MHSPRDLRLNIFMIRTEKELAFLRDLYIAGDWTERFTNLIGKNLDAKNTGELLYVNAGTGNFALDLEEKLAEDAELTCVCENEELMTIARAKAEAVKSDIKFRATLPGERFDAVLADASFIRPAELKDFLAETADLSREQFAFFLPTRGSFGEIFSYLWQTLLEMDWLERSAEVERLITELPAVSDAEEIAENLGLSKLHTETKNEIFEFENGAEFVNSPLIADFLLPAWLGFLNEEEQDQVSERLAQTVDADIEGMSFRFSVKMTLVVGEKTADF